VGGEDAPPSRAGMPALFGKKTAREGENVKNGRKKWKWRDAPAVLREELRREGDVLEFESTRLHSEGVAKDDRVMAEGATTRTTD
jgi:hypothetical protein